jgi:hypothetical protein
VNRRMVTIIGIAGAIVGIPAIAFAISFIFAIIEGETTRHYRGVAEQR